MSKPRFWVLVCMILAAAASRLIPHPPNAASITAVALFGGAYLSDKRLAFLAPIAALFLSDLVLGLYGHMEVVYGSFALVVCIGLLLRKRRSPLAIGGAALASSIVFFVVTNFGVWLFGSLYPGTMAGLFACYVAAIPFFQNTLVGDALYTVALFGGFALAERWWPALRESSLARPRSA
ncbi:MAG: DUF6580 family putative transport protein [Pyrinomonadaceae bacterium]